MNSRMKKSALNTPTLSTEIFSTCDQLSRQLEKMAKSEFHNIITGINNLILFVVIYCFQFKKFSGLI